MRHLIKQNTETYIYAVVKAPCLVDKLTKRRVHNSDRFAAPDAGWITVVCVIKMLHSTPYFYLLRFNDV